MANVRRYRFQLWGELGTYETSKEICLRLFSSFRRTPESRFLDLLQAAIANDVDQQVKSAAT
jgi:hypothetical protein